jgi:hypothetical protein
VICKIRTWTVVPRLCRGSLLSSFFSYFSDIIQVWIILYICSKRAFFFFLFFSLWSCWKNKWICYSEFVLAWFFFFFENLMQASLEAEIASKLEICYRNFILLNWTFDSCMYVYSYAFVILLVFFLFLFLFHSEFN